MYRSHALITIGSETPGPAAGGFYLHLKPLSAYLSRLEPCIRQLQETENPAQREFADSGNWPCEHRPGFRPGCNNLGSDLSQSSLFAP